MPTVASPMLDVTLNAEDLAEALGLITRIASRKSTIPVLKFARLSVHSGVANIYATDIDVRARVPLLVNGMRDGEALVPAGRLHELCGLTSSPVQIVATEKDTKIIIDKHVSVFKTLPLHEFPAFPVFDSPASCVLKSSVLASMIQRVEKTICNDAAAANGVEFYIADSKLRLISCDQHRGSISITPATTHGPAITFVWPRTTLADLVTFLSDSEDVSLGVCEGVAFIECGGRTLHARTLEANMPNLNRVIPAEFHGSFLIDRDVMLTALRRVGAVQTCDAASIAVTLDVKPDRLHLSASAADVGESDEEVIVTTSGVPCTFKLNTKYLLDLLATCARGNVELEYVKDAMRVVRCSQPDEKITKSLMAIMPMAR